VLSDPSLPDNPIVYCSEGFCNLTGYKRSEVLGRNCRFLQGPGTDQGAVDIIRKGVAEGRDISVCLLNYKADGSPFWNQFFVGALRDMADNVVNYVGIQCEVNTLPIEEIKERVKRLPMYVPPRMYVCVFTFRSVTQPFVLFHVLGRIRCDGKAEGGTRHGGAGRGGTGRSEGRLRVR